jgi:hypothetical protein
MTLRTAAMVAAIGLSLGLAACETATPYQPLEHGSQVSGGYSDQKLDANHIQVTFAGNTVTSRKTVEQYLLYRAAELTVSQGYDWFETIDRWTDVSGHTTIYGGGWGYGGFGPAWRYYGGWGWGPWGPWGGWDTTVTEVRQFEATAVVVMHHDPRPPGYARGLDAREVMNNLRLQIVLPQPPKKT